MRGIGANAEKVFSVAVRFTNDELAQYYGHGINRIRIFIRAGGGYPLGGDGGPMVEGKGAWIRWTNTWQELTELNENLNFKGK